MREENLGFRIKKKGDRKLWLLLSLALFLIVLFFAAMVVVLKEDKAARSDEDYYPGLSGEKSLPKERAGDKENLLFLGMDDEPVNMADNDDDTDPQGAEERGNDEVADINDSSDDSISDSTVSTESGEIGSGDMIDGADMSADGPDGLSSPDNNFGGGGTDLPVIPSLELPALPPQAIKAAISDTEKLSAVTRVEIKEGLNEDTILVNISAVRGTTSSTAKDIADNFIRKIADYSASHSSDFKDGSGRESYGDVWKIYNADIMVETSFNVFVAKGYLAKGANQISW